MKATLRYFLDEYKAHIEDKYCPAGVCKVLVRHAASTRARWVDVPSVR